MTASPDLEARYLSTAVRYPAWASESPVDPGDFAVALHGRVAAELFRRLESGEPCTLLDFEMWGGCGNVLDAPFARLPASFAEMARRLRSLAVARRGREYATLAAEAWGRGQDEEARALLARALEDTPEDGGQLTVSMRSAVHDLFRETAARTEAKRSGNDDTLLTGFHVWDKSVGALGGGDMVVIGGDTNAGKSQLCLALAIAWDRQQINTGILTLEDHLSIWAGRAIAHHGRISADKWRTLELNREEWRQASEDAARAQSERIWLSYLTSDRSIDACKAAMRELVIKRKARVIVCDYLQVIRPSERRPTAQLRQEMSEAAADLKSCAMGLGVPLVLTSQLTRRGDGKEPGMHAFKETGDIENMMEAGVVLWKDKPEDERCPTMGKVVKVKWTGRRPRFQLQRNAAGMVTDLCEVMVERKSDNVFSDGGAR